MADGLSHEWEGCWMFVPYAIRHMPYAPRPRESHSSRIPQIYEPIDQRDQQRPADEVANGHEHEVGHRPRY